MTKKRRAVAQLDFAATPVATRHGSHVRRRSSRRVEGAPLVLVVDDDPEMRAALARVVLRQFRVIEAPNAHEGVALCVTERPRLVVSDYDMPGRAGDELVAMLEVALGSDAPPVIIVTGGDPLRVPEGCAAAVLTKPVEPSVLLGALEQVLARQRAKDAARGGGGDAP
jgi:DNA-binding response OmpR family regulator